MERLTLTSKFMVNPDVVYTNIENDIVMMLPEDGSYYSINEIGTEIWNLLSAKPSSLEALCRYVQEHYEVTEEQSIVDISTFLNTMLEQKIVIRQEQ
jgi:hypothetical protein